MSSKLEKLPLVQLEKLPKEIFVGKSSGISERMHYLAGWKDGKAEARMELIEKLEACIRTRNSQADTSYKIGMVAGLEQFRQSLLEEAK